MEPMTSDDVRLVQQSWDKAEFVKDVTAELFFSRLFQLAPELEPLFAADSRERERKFTQFVGTTVRGLNRVEALSPAVRELGARHPALAANEEMHANVAAALLWTLHKSLRREFTPEVRGAWINAYSTLSEAMRDAGGAPRAA